MANSLSIVGGATQRFTFTVREGGASSPPLDLTDFILQPSCYEFPAMLPEIEAVDLAQGEFMVVFSPELTWQIKSATSLYKLRVVMTYPSGDVKIIGPIDCKVS